ncbi:hypothetical protein GE061_019199 [Apolygus lucorum]|uniref:Uncharacterized protein n=1 Tax=Apolygus lucorum TaxID=248454 RepID=A0A6A4JEQ5_APOLU|nr:hypothetical protein GE061_019199 [Apolygus lucorum]
MDSMDFDAVCGAAAPTLTNLTKGRPRRRTKCGPPTTAQPARPICPPAPPPRHPSTRLSCAPAPRDYYANVPMSCPPMSAQGMCPPQTPRRVMVPPNFYIPPPPPGSPPPFSEYVREAVRGRPPAPMPRAQAMCRPPMPLPKPEGLPPCPPEVQQRRGRNPARYMRKRFREGMACVQGRRRSPSPPYYANLC